MCQYKYIFQTKILDVNSTLSDDKINSNICLDTRIFTAETSLNWKIDKAKQEMKME